MDIAKLWRKKFAVPVRADTPYAKASQEWDDRIGSARVQARNWRLAFFFTLAGVTMPSLYGNIYQAGLPRQIPVFVEVNNKTGVVTPVGKIGEEWGSYKPKDGVINEMLRNFIRNSRTITKDKKLLQSLWANIYYYSTGSASKMLEGQWVAAMGEYDKPNPTSVYVSEITPSKMNEGENTWLVFWREQTYSEYGKLLKDEKMRGSFIIVSEQPKNEDELKKNSLGIRISEFYITSGEEK